MSSKSFRVFQDGVCNDILEYFTGVNDFDTEKFNFKWGTLERHFHSGTLRQLEHVLREGSQISMNCIKELLRPVLKAGGPARAPLPLWTWIEHGSVAAVEALLRSTETVCVEDVITLQRCRLPQREQIQDLLQRKCGEEEFLRLQTEAATRRLLQELREAFDDQRDVKLLTLQNSLDLGADANAQEEESEETAEFQEGSYSLSALQLLVTNLHASEETMRQAVKSLVEAKADVNCEVSETPLLSALQSRCVSGLRAVCEHGARLSSDVLDELKTISSSKVRGALEDILQPLILKDGICFAKHREGDHGG
eukprot:s615_g15.t1